LQEPYPNIPHLKYKSTVPLVSFNKMFGKENKEIIGGP